MYGLLYEKVFVKVFLPLHTVHNVHVPLLLVAGVGTKGPETADEVFTPVHRLVFTERRVEGLHFDHVGQLP